MVNRRRTFIWLSWKFCKVLWPNVSFPSYGKEKKTYKSLALNEPCGYYLRAVFYSLESLRTIEAFALQGIHSANHYVIATIVHVHVYTCSLSVLLPAMQMSHKTQRWLSDCHWQLFAHEFVCHIYLLWLLFKGGVYFTQSFRLWVATI